MKQEKTEIDRELESGKYLFKYCKFDVNALQIITNNTLYFSSANNLNDPLDSNFELEIKNPLNFSEITKNIIRDSLLVQNRSINYLLKKHELKMGDISSQKELFRAFFSHIQNTESGICCFSRTINNHLMWSHYADGDKGLCLVFDKGKLDESFERRLKSQKIKRYRMVHRHITYGKIPVLNILLYKRGGFSYSERHLFSKVADWKYEKEYRFVLQLNTNKFFIDDISSFNPFFEFEKDCLRFIIVGSRMPQEHRNMIKNIAAANSFGDRLLERNLSFI